ncbi:SpoIIE family protein phosphatase [Streptacidiphilus griseoplanus]|uniref:SpoIIE family protein phosphatase n=1 Tax=Peterkaempfera griseoplana TaxID=66896 RepID=UPI0006E241B1|nr:SpoIIE family protein phosphatase [Peterkaempfera griseoplana]
MDRELGGVGGPAGGPSPDPFQGAQAATAMLDAQGTVVRWSTAAEQLVDRPASAVLGRPVTSLLAGAGRGRTEAMVAQLLASGQPWQRALLVRRGDGRLLTVTVRAFPSIGPEPVPSWVLLAAPAAEARRREEEQAVLTALFTDSPVGLMVSDLRLRCIRRNPALEQMTGVPDGEGLGRRLGESLPEVDSLAVETAMREVLETGVPQLDIVHRGRTPAFPDQETTWSTSLFRLTDSHGGVIGVCHLVVDVTDRQRTLARVALINEASLRIGTTLDVGRTAQELADVAAPALADTVTVDLLDSVLQGEAPSPGPVGEDVTLRRCGYRSDWKGPSRAVCEIGEPARFSRFSPQARCMTDLQARLVALSEEPQDWQLDDPRRAEAMAEAGVHSLIAVPLTARDVLMGVATFYRWRKPSPFDDEDLSLIAELAARASVCIDNARRYTREHRATLALQRRMLPSSSPPLTALETAGRYQPAGERSEVGGDWLDVIPLSGARVALVVGDVPGHGFQAAATMGRLRTAVHTLADLDLAPDELLTHLDDLVSRLTEEEDEALPAGLSEGPVTGATCLFAVYDPADRRCTLASAGHYPPAVVHPDGEVRFPDLAPGPPLGLGGVPFETTELELPDRSLLALYTNGLLLARDRDIDRGLGELRRILARPERPLEEICDQVFSELLPFRPPDDVSLLIARTRVLGADRVAAWDLPSDPAMVLDARTLATDKLADWGLTDILFTAELVVSELVTNAVRYGRPPIRLRLIRDSALICEVSDGSSTSPHLRRARLDDEGGRGLFLIAQLTQRWGTRYSGTGKTIWAEVPLTPLA